MKRIWWFALTVVAVLTLLAVVPIAAHAAVMISVNIAPPPLPIYEQPLIPGDGYVWVPGYWAWGPYGYYWVPGEWVLPPSEDLLWTPGYWGWGDTDYIWHAGYWGREVGFYGGINYGFGYNGVGYDGGYWRDRHFFYNRAVNNINVTVIHNVYERQVARPNEAFAHTSFNGGNGGVQSRASAQQMTAARDRHIAATQAQSARQAEAGRNRAQFFSANGGHPPIAAMASPNDRSHIVAAQGAPAQPNLAAVRPMNPHAVANSAPNNNHGAPNNNRGPAPNNPAAAARTGVNPPVAPNPAANARFEHGRAGNNQPNSPRMSSNSAAAAANAGNVRAAADARAHQNEQDNRQQPQPNAMNSRPSNNVRPAIHAPAPAPQSAPNPASNGHNQHLWSERMPNGERPGPGIGSSAPHVAPMAAAPHPDAAPSPRPAPAATAPRPMPPAPHPAPMAVPHPAPMTAPHPAPMAAPHGGGSGEEHHH